MKHPKLSDMKIDVPGTKSMRSKVAKSKKIKITINIDDDLLASLRGKSEKTGIPYQSLLNRLLRDAVNKFSDEESRLDKLEREVKDLKKRLSA
jgi:predicted DNA binding CopG/RHH family protein